MLSHAEFIQEEVSTEIEWSVVITEEDEDDLSLSEWVRRTDNVNFASCDLDGFSSIDDDILTTETLTAEDIVTEVKNQQTLHLMKRIYKKKKKKKKILKNKKLKLMCRE